MTRRDSNRHWIGNAALALVWPPAVGRAGAFAPWWWCWLVGGACVAVCGGTWGAARLTGGGEPFMNLLDYVSHFLWFAFWVTLMASIPAIMLTFAALGSFHAHWESRGTPARLARIRALMLAPLAGTIPFLGAQLCTLMIEARPGSFSFTWAAKPGWISSEVFDVGEWGLTGLAIACVLFAMVMGMSVAARLAPTSNSCRRCGYDLSGLTGAVCPECGGALPHRKGAAA